MNYLLILCLVIFKLSTTSALDYHVNTSKALQNALNTVSSGDTIYLADGIYLGKFKSIGRNGTSEKPITIKGSKNSILSGTSLKTGNALHLNNSNYWVLNGFTIMNSLKGLMLDYSNFNKIVKIYVHHIGQEAVHFRCNSSDNIIQNSTISFTGLIEPGYGEGIYVGSANTNWVNNQPDLSNRNKIMFNLLGPNITAEAIDIKEATSFGLIDGNFFDGTGVSGVHFADSWVDVKGNNYTIVNNVGVYSLLDGFQVHDQRKEMIPNYAKMFPSGCNNVFKNNKCSKLGSAGKCVQLDSVKLCTNQNINNIII